MVAVMSKMMGGDLEDSNPNFVQGMCGPAHARHFNSVVLSGVR